MIRKYISQDSSVSKGTAYELDDRDSIPVRGRNISVLCYIQTSSGLHPASKWVLEIKQLQHDSDHSHPSCVETKNV